MTQALALPLLTSLDSQDQYLREIKSYPLLSAEEEFELATRLKKQEDLDAAKILILSHLRLVASIARTYVGYGLPQADLIQEGNIGLMKAVRRFDPDRGVRLVSFAVHWIKAEMHEYIVKNWRLVKIATTKAQRKLFFNLRSMKQGLNSLTQEEANQIARDLNVKPEEVFEMEARLNGHEFSLEGQADESEDEGYSPIAYLSAENADPSELLSQQQLEQRQTEGLTNALERLDARSRRIVQARWLQEGESATLHELAAELEISAERVRQIEQKAMQKIKLELLAA